MKDKKGFTLVELLAVIAILAILVIIALPNVINMYNRAQKETFLTEAKKVYTEAEKKYISSSINGNVVKVINSEDSSKLDMTGEKLKYCIVLNNNGKVSKMQVSNGKWVASLDGSKSVDELTIDDLKDGDLSNSTCESSKTKSFVDDDWSTIVEAVKNGDTSNYKVGDTKEINLGNFGKHTVRIANMSTPSECSTSGFSQTACGFVLEFSDIIITSSINSTGVSDWTKSTLYSYLNINIYNELPDELRNSVINTTVVSSPGIDHEENVVSTDKMYLLAPKEIFGDWSEQYDISKNLTRQLDYYKSKGTTLSSNSGAIKSKEATNTAWWTRSADHIDNELFFVVYDQGNCASEPVKTEYGVSPAFRIG